MTPERREGWLRAAKADRSAIVLDDFASVFGLFMRWLWLVGSTLGRLRWRFLRVRMGARSSSSELDESEEVMYLVSGYESREGEKWRAGVTSTTYPPRRAASLAPTRPEVSVSSE